MKAFSIVLVSILFCANCLALPRSLLDREPSENGSDASPPNDGAFEETAEASVTAPDMVGPAVEECFNINLGVTVQILEGTNLQNLTTSNAFACCEACQEVHACSSWIHNRANGLCSLYNVTSANVTRSPESELDVGGFAMTDDLTPKSPTPRIASPFSSVSTNSSASPRSFVFLESPGPSRLPGSPSHGSPFGPLALNTFPGYVVTSGTLFGRPASDSLLSSSTSLRHAIVGSGFALRGRTTVPVPQCSINQGVTYPRGDVLVAGRTGSATFCCNLCRLSSNCKSWFYNSKNDRCTVNRDIPASVSRDSSQFKGGTVFR